ncbi:TatD family hydrolase [Thermoactinomyces mirandus]|uniref:TatD family hydrolase n=1 Tax=Thermoactinomyces mirandus TaxID=2756294 RepID=A0A7W2AQF0_9BACL|nr:TatD family hydrolase [Thermoactinomyces mirandus]MBA4601237.1 TatD family hydrolase [Thermoactinomyces mirandus]
MLFDTHTHLNDPKFDEDREQVIERAREEYGVKYILNVGFNRETIFQTLKLAEEYPFIYASVGWHPTDATDCTEEDLAWIRSLAAHPKVVAIGEIGLDYYWNTAPKEEQAVLFRRQIAIAKETGLPIIVHNRDANDDVVRILKEEHAEEVGGVMHCFSGDLTVMEECLELDFMIGLGGPVTFKNGKLAQEIAAHVPLDRLLLETDCPYLAPHPYRGKRNETGYVRLVAEKIAGIRGLSLEELAQATMQNAFRLFGISEEN